MTCGFFYFGLADFDGKWIDAQCYWCFNGLIIAEIKMEGEVSFSVEMDSEKWVEKR